MYIQGTRQYESHVKTFGHPLQFGYKDICHLEGAEKWDPEGLIRLYKSASAEYFVALATYHDNFGRCVPMYYRPSKAETSGLWNSSSWSL
jgi:alpha-L-fucosidase